MQQRLARAAISWLRINSLPANQLAHRAYRRTGFADYEVTHKKRLHPAQEA